MGQKTRKYNKRTTLRKRQSKRNFRKKKSKRNVGKKRGKRNGRKTIKRGGTAEQKRGAKRPVEEKNSVTNRPNMPTEEDRGAEGAENGKKAKIYTNSIGRQGILPSKPMKYMRVDPMADRAVLITELRLFPKEYWRIMGASKELKGDKDFMMKAVKINGMALLYASDELKEDEQLVRAAIATTPDDGVQELAGTNMFLTLQKEYEERKKRL
jgi:hypothetical protein